MSLSTRYHCASRLGSWQLALPQGKLRRRFQHSFQRSGQSHSSTPGPHADFLEIGTTLVSLHDVQHPSCSPSVQVGVWLQDQMNQRRRVRSVFPRFLHQPRGIASVHHFACFQGEILRLPVVRIPMKRTSVPRIKSHPVSSRLCDVRQCSGGFVGSRPHLLSFGLPSPVRRVVHRRRREDHKKSARSRLWTTHVVLGGPFGRIDRAKGQREDGLASRFVAS